jgi:hypothetical protein
VLVHTPEDGHVAAVPQAHEAVHVWMLAPPMHCVSPGLHAPPPEQSPHAPAAVQLCVPVLQFPQACMAPGLHATQAPSRHAGVVPEQTGQLHVPQPPSTQVCVPLVLHAWVAPSAHTTHCSYCESVVVVSHTSPVPSQ